MLEEFSFYTSIINSFHRYLIIYVTSTIDSLVNINRKHTAPKRRRAEKEKYRGQNINKESGSTNEGLTGTRRERKDHRRE